MLSPRQRRLGRIGKMLVRIYVTVVRLAYNSGNRGVALATPYQQALPTLE